MHAPPYHFGARGPMRARGSGPDAIVARRLCPRCRPCGVRALARRSHDYLPAVVDAVLFDSLVQTTCTRRVTMLPRHEFWHPCT